MSCVCLALLGACSSEAPQLHCDDLLPASESGYARVAELVVEPGSKTCGSCHNTDTPLGGYNFEGRGVAYDALRTKMPTIYTQVASGGMPEKGESWSDADVRLLRSWYCYGAIYED
jgi:mono/diheme cytochrome c family protein